LSRHDEFLSLKELHRLPPPPRGQTSTQARYLTTSTTAAQRLRALGGSGQTVDRWPGCLDVGESGMAAIGGKRTLS